MSIVMISKTDWEKTKLNSFKTEHEILEIVNQLNIEDLQTVANIFSEKLGDFGYQNFYRVEKTWYNQDQLTAKWSTLFNGQWDLLFSRSFRIRSFKP